METIIIILLVLIMVMLIILLLNKNNNKETSILLSKDINELNANIIKEIGSFKYDFSRNMNDDFNKLNNRIEDNLLKINEKVNHRLDENFEKTNKTFTNVLERLSRIDEAQKKIESLSTDIVGLQNILTDKKTRGIFGEVNLKQILVSVFGEGKDNIYKMQHKFDNNTIADCVLFAPEPLGTIAIDSKFPLEHYKQMVDKDLSQQERNLALKAFKNDMKNHLDAISSKYIIPGVTSDQAILFLPAEAIFAEINAYYNDIIEYAYNKKVWITSPTTLMSTLTTIQVIIKNVERDKYASIIHKELALLAEEFDRYKERWGKLSRSIETVTKDVKDLNVTGEKISKRFASIHNVEVKKIESSEENE